ncbi:MAG TPA: OmpA family protein, partial [Polyangiaceae bacterium]|nr:OmpA family protein [Polyangiaceae bacterium]
MSQGNAPQIRMLGAVPRVVLARLHMFFNTNKAFLLPTALPSMQKLRQVYADNSPGKLLVVGHADTKGGTAYNDKLSLERAQATIAYLKDEVQTWLDFYRKSVEATKRWGKVEDRLMIISMPDFDTKPKGEDAVSWYQRTRKLTVDGKAGTETRTQLIQEYMSLDGASLADSGIEIETIAHGCGENFPLDDTGDKLDSGATNEKRDPIDRRVELFFFDADFGVVPAPPGDNSSRGSKQYPAWRKRVEETVELRAEDADGPKVTFIEMADAHFRTNSAVVLPEGENPDARGSHQAFTSVGVIATALRFNEEHPGRTLLVAGHTDSTATPAFNQLLSEERAQLTLALLKGGNASRETFKKLAQGRHTVEDIKQILSWAARALPGFDCEPGAIDDNPVTANEPVRRFQNSYNAQRATIAPSSTAALERDGSVGPLTWGAFYDCYEFALQQELGEDAAGLQALRDKLIFADPQHESLGFSEYFPIDELGVDNFRSKTNRRVEVLFFEQGEEPDIPHAAADPETSDLYLPGHYQRTSMDVRTTAKTTGNLCVYTFAEPDEELELLVRSQSGETVASFGREHGETVGSAVLFQLDPDNLPNPTSLAFKRGDLIEEHGSPFDPGAALEGFDNGRLADATDVVRGAESPDNRVAGPGAGTSASTGPTPALSDLRIVVRFANPGHRFLQLARVTLNGALAVPGDSRQGSHVFDVPAGATQLQLQVLIPPLAPRATKNILLVNQTYNLFANTASGFRVPARMITEVGRRHARVRNIGMGSKVGTLQIDLDLRFLDVTDHVRVSASTFRVFEQGSLSGCNLAIFEQTDPTGESNPSSATSWAVLIPPAVAGSDEFSINALLFFQHELEHHMLEVQFTDTSDRGLAYNNSDDVDYDRLTRYLPPPSRPDDLLPPPAQFRPSYVTRTHDDPVGNSPSPSTQFPPNEHFNNYPSFNWAQQLVNSEKRVVLLMPFPKRTSFGQLNQPSSANLRLLQSLTSSLEAEGQIKPKHSALLAGLAIGGWSSGTKTVVDWCAGLVGSDSALPPVVREVYFFDGFEDSKVGLFPGGAVENWFREDRSRKLRLVCTAYTEKEAIDLARRLGATEALDVVLDAGGTPVKGNVRVMPGRSDYFYTNALYKAAFGLPPDPSVVAQPAISLTLRGPGQAQVTPDVSAEAALTLDTESFRGGTPTAFIVLSSRQASLTHQLANYSSTEAAAVLHYIVLPFVLGLPLGTSRPVQSKADFDTAMKSLRDSGDPN